MKIQNFKHWQKLKKKQLRKKKTNFEIRRHYKQRFPDISKIS